MGLLGWSIVLGIGVAVVYFVIVIRNLAVEDHTGYSNNCKNQRKRYIEHLERDNPSFPKLAIKEFLKKNGFFDNQNWYRIGAICDDCQSWIYKTQAAEQWKAEAPSALQRERQKIQSELARNEGVIKQFGVCLPQFPSWWNNDQAALELDSFFLAIQSVDFCSLVRGMVAKAQFGGDTNDPLSPPPFAALVQMSYGEHFIDGQSNTGPASAQDLKERIVREYETFQAKQIGHIVPPEMLLSCLRQETPDQLDHFEYGAVFMAFSTAFQKLDVYVEARELHNRFDDLVHQQYPLSWLSSFMQDRMRPGSSLKELQGAVYDLEQELHTCERAMSSRRKDLQRVKSQQAAAESEQQRHRAEAEARRVQWVKAEEEEKERERVLHEQSFEGQMQRLNAEHEERMRVIARLSDEEARLQAEELEAGRYFDAIRELVNESAGSKKV